MSSLLLEMTAHVWCLGPNETQRSAKLNDVGHPLYPLVYVSGSLFLDIAIAVLGKLLLLLLNRLYRPFAVFSEDLSVTAADTTCNLELRISFRVCSGENVKY